MSALVCHISIGIFKEIGFFTVQCHGGMGFYWNSGSYTLVIFKILLE